MLKNGLKRRDLIKVLSIGGSGLLVGCTFNSHKIFSEGNYINFEPFIIQFKNDLYNINGTLLNGRLKNDNLYLIPINFKNGSLK